MNLKLENAYKEYSGVRVLDIDKLEFTEGKIYVILGSNGSGKSTLVNCIAGFNSFSGGSVLYNNECINYKIRNSISIMVQKPYLFNDTSLNNIVSGLKFRKISKNEIAERLERYLSYLDINELKHKKSKWLSGGERAKIALLRTAILETDLTLLDEPTASMDIESTINAEILIKSMSGGKRTIIIITHDVYQAGRIADYVLFMDKGKVIEMGLKDKVLKNPENNLVKQLMNMKI
ncbi:tungstate transport system ATP-binding protein [Sedimentibacter acidaminivorans]|uniref:Tungstate transport system ATP-binding protein n=1 Tax=Sedimentibacter acidaminivorans TaxID=913099 RepID=A0ABS4GHH9_9FIRM|nr:energy-coupling factor ABC transporter ATP-binding protein [Sedimentibacter acidaminivorans]MBP1927136.1 tungstate transport system ATP-binding protein [Sedimentibacter acidaminivorans]